MAGRPAHLRTAAIIGLGRIGAGNQGLAGQIPMSHLAAILATPQLRIVALVDPDAAMRGQVDTGAPEMDGVTIAESIDAVRGSADVVAICTPAETHAPILKQALRLSPRVVICEKP